MLRSENVWRVADVSWWFDIHKCSFYLTMRCGACKMGILDRQIPNWRQWCYFYSNAKQKYFNLRKDLEIATNKNSQNKCYVILSMTLSCISKIFFLICIQMSSCISQGFYEYAFKCHAYPMNNYEYVFRCPRVVCILQYSEYVLLY